MIVIRRSGAASAAVLVGLTASWMAAHLLAPDWSRRAGLDVWNLASAEQERKRVAETNAELDACRNQLDRRINASNHVTGQLIAGEITLATAADQLALIFRNFPSNHLMLKEQYGPVPSERHLFALHAIDRADRLLADDPARRDSIRARLEAEYRQLSSGQ